MASQFNDTTNFTGLAQDIDFFCGSNSTSYPLADKARNLNHWAFRGVLLKLKSNKKWQFDDPQKTDLPIFTTNLVVGQRDYSLPTDLLTLEAVEVKDSAGNFTRLDLIDSESDLKKTISSSFPSNGFPVYYDPRYNSIFIYPAADSTSCTLTNGLKIFYSRDFTLFTSTGHDTYTGPLESPFSRYLSLGASFDFCLVNNPDRAKVLRQEILLAEKELVKLSSIKSGETRINIRPAHRQSNYV